MARSNRWRVVLALLPALAACNAVIGLSDYKQGECSGGGACIDARADVANDPVDAASDVATDATGTQPVSWLRRKMPNYPQDGGPGVNVQSYTVGNGSITEAVSGLTWREPAEVDAKTFAEAQRVCVNGWRLPTRVELVTLLDLGRRPTIDAKFASTREEAYWSTSEVRPYGAGGRRERWTVDFSNGEVGKTLETDRKGVRCIKAQ